MAQNSNVPRSQEDYITQVSEEIEGRVSKKLSQEFSRTENRILGALARLDDFLMSPLIQGHSGTAPETTRNVFSVSQGTNEDDSQSKPHPEVGIFNNQLAQNAGPEVGHDMVTVATEQIGDRHDNVVSGFASSKFPTVINRTKFFFRFRFLSFCAIVHTSSYWDGVVCSGWLQLGKWTF